MQIKNKLFTAILKYQQKLIIILISILVLIIGIQIQCATKKKASTKDLNSLKEVAVPPTSTTCSGIAIILYLFSLTTIAP